MARADATGSPVDDTSTGSPAFISTDSVSDAKAMPSLPRWPCEAMKIRSQPLACAASTIACAGLSLTAWRDSHGTPSARAAASALASNSRALPTIGVVVFVARRQAQHLGFAAQRAGGVGHGVEEGDARAERARQRNGVADHFDRQVGAVDGNEQMAIHGQTSGSESRPC